MTDENIGPGSPALLTIDVGPLLGKVSDFVSELGRDLELQEAFLRDPTGTLISRDLAPPADSDAISTTNRLMFSLLANRRALALLSRQLTEVPLPSELARSLAASTRDQLQRDQGQRLEFRSDLMEALLQAEVADTDRLRELLEAVFSDETVRQVLGFSDEEARTIVDRIIRDLRSGTPLDRLGVVASIDREGRHVIASGEVVGDQVVRFGFVGVFVFVVAVAIVKTVVNVNAAANVNVTANVNANVNANVAVENVLTANQLRELNDPYDAIRQASLLFQLTGFVGRLVEVIDERGRYA
jgi:hypothetical protein